MDEAAVRSAYREIRDAAKGLRLTKEQRSRLWSGVGHLYDAMHRNPGRDAWGRIAVDAPTTHAAPLKPQDPTQPENGP